MKRFISYAAFVAALFTVAVLVAAGGNSNRAHAETNAGAASAQKILAEELLRANIQLASLETRRKEMVQSVMESFQAAATRFSPGTALYTLEELSLRTAIRIAIVCPLHPQADPSIDEQISLIADAYVQQLGKLIPEAQGTQVVERGRKKLVSSLQFSKLTPLLPQLKEPLSDDELVAFQSAIHDALGLVVEEQLLESPAWRDANEIERRAIWMRKFGLADEVADKGARAVSRLLEQQWPTRDGNASADAHMPPCEVLSADEEEAVRRALEQASAELEKDGAAAGGYSPD